MEWISVKDQIPEPEVDVLTCCVSHGKTIGGFVNRYPEGEKYMAVDQRVRWADLPNPSFRSDRFLGKVTHWMPLPALPKV